jgi:peptidoglycan/LPS O-acetylase OafA/YrhL
VTSNASSRERGLDSLRAFAIAVVMLYHLRPWLPESLGAIGQYGWMGVDLFFVLSGYLIGSQLLGPYAKGERPSIWRFYRRRALRILPAYLVVVSLYAVWPAWREFPGFGPIWKFLTFTENLFFLPQYRAFSHVWSLCVEEHFYLFLPLLAAALMRRPSVRKTILLLTFVLAFGIALRGYAILYTDDFMRILYYPTWMRLDGLLAGVSLAILRVFQPACWDRIKARGHATFAAGLALVGCVLWLFRGDTLGDQEGSGAWGMVFGLPLLAIGLGLCLMSSVSRNGLLSRLRVPGARIVAMLAYALYLTHKAIVHLDQTYLPSLTAERDVKAAMLYAFTCLAAAAILHFAIEKPSLALRNWWERPREPATEREMLADPAL